MDTLPQNTPTAAPTGPGSITLNDGTQLDGGVVKVMRAIRQVESQGNFNAVGDNGSSLGAYQWNNDNIPLKPGELPSHFVNAAKTFGYDPTDFSPANQNKVAYAQIAQYKKDGRTPIEIDALWNGAHKDPATGQYVHNAPERLTKFQQALAQQTQGTQAQPNQPAAQIASTADGDQNQPGFLQGLYQAIAGPVVNLLARPGQAVQHALGDTQPLSGDVFGVHVNDPYEDVQNGKSPLDAVTSDVGRGIQTVGLGLGPVAGGAAFGGGYALQQNEPYLPSLDHPLDNALVQTALGAVLGKAADVGVKYVGKGLSLFGEALQTSSAAQTLLESAAKNWERILNPTTKALKSATSDIVPYLAQQGEIYTSRGAFLQEAEARANVAGDVIDTIWNSVPEGTKVDATPVGAYLMQQLRALQIHTPNGAMVPQENQSLYQALDNKVQELIKLTDDHGKVDVNQLRAWRQSGDAFIQKAKPYQFAASEGDRASVSATKSATKAARNSLNKNIDGLPDANKMYHVWDTARDVMDATLLRKVGQGTPLAETINTAAGLTFGAGTITHALSAAVVMKYATKLINSTLFQSTSAAVKSALARAILSGDSSTILHVLLSVMKGGGVAAKVVGDFLQGLPDAARILPFKDIPGTSLGATKDNIAHGDNVGADATLSKAGESVSSDTIASKPSAAANTSTGSALTGRGDVSAQRADTSAPFNGEGVSGAKDQIQTIENQSGPSNNNSTFERIKEFLKQLSSKNPRGFVAVPFSHGDGAPFRGFRDLTTDTLDDLKGRTTVSKQYLLDSTNRPGLRQAERDLIRGLLEGEPDKINIKDFAEKVKGALLPLKRLENDAPHYERVNLPDELRGPVADYKEHIYESPIATNAGEVHFDQDTSGRGANDFEHYFAHTRVEDLPKSNMTPQERYSFDQGAKIGELQNGTTRRVIEIQSDLFQKGRLEKESAPRTFDWHNAPEYKSLTPDEKATFDNIIAKDPNSPEQTNKAWDAVGKSINARRAAEVSKLEPYRNTWWERIVREEYKQAAKDGKAKLQIPTGDTAMKIEGLGGDGVDFRVNGYRVEPNNLKVGDVGEFTRGFEGDGDQWIITEVLGDGKFKAVPKDNGDFLPGKDGLEMQDFDSEGNEISVPVPEQMKETFDISGKVDTNNPIYRFYEKDIGKYLTNKFGAQRITDPQGVSWWEVNVDKKAARQPVKAFGNAPIKTLAAGAAASGAVAAGAAVGSIPSKVSADNTPITKGREQLASKVVEAIGKNETASVEDPYTYSQKSGVKALGDALGKYQITEGELKKNGQKYLGRIPTKKEFLSSPELQDRYMQAKVADLIGKGYTPEQVADIHRSGSTNEDGSYKHPGYVQSFEKYLNGQEPDQQ